MSTTVIIALLVMSAAALGKVSYPVKLTADIDKPLMLAGQKQTAYIRVSLEGVDLISRHKERMPVNIALVIDKSGSMGGSKIEQAKQGAITAINRLGSLDIISIITYDTEVKVLLPSTKLTNKQEVINMIRSIQAGGSTALYGGVSKGGQELKKFLDDKYVNRLVLLSDGLANVGPSSSADIERLGMSLIENGISVTTMGVGLGYNEDLMSKLAFKSDGNHYFIENAKDLVNIFEKEFGQTMSVVATDVQTEIICPDGVRPVKVLGREGTIKGNKTTVSMGQIYSKHKKYFILEVEVDANENNSIAQLAEIKVTCKSSLFDAYKMKLNASVSSRFTTSKELVAKHINKSVMADVVEQIAVERNELALELRDKGQIKKAQEILYGNTVYLRDNAKKYNSQKLDDYAGFNYVDAEKMEAKDWGKQRKSMRAEQTGRRSNR